MSAFTSHCLSPSMYACKCVFVPVAASQPAAAGAGLGAAGVKAPAAVGSAASVVV